jgi:hypothetical protein
MNASRLICVLFCTLFMSSQIWAEDTIVVKHYQQQARYEFGLKVLDLVLSKLGENYEIVGPKAQDINEARGEYLITSGLLDLEFISTTALRESSMIAIKTPIYRGFLGLRLLLVKPSSNDAIKNVTNLNTLQKYIAGHGKHWGDLPVYAANDLKVVPVVQYNNLFKMLKQGRFDYLNRGANEIWEEQARYSDDFVVADNIMLFYPHPVYFFVGKHRPNLAKKIEKGLSIALEDGSYQKLFQAQFKDAITRAKINSRTLITLKNPVVPIGTTPIDTSWWMPQNQLNK